MLLTVVKLHGSPISEMCQRAGITRQGDAALAEERETLGDRSKAAREAPNHFMQLADDSGRQGDGIQRRTNAK